MSSQFIKISNDFFKPEKTNLFKRIGTEGFLLYTYLLYQQGMNLTLNTTLKIIQSSINKDYTKRQSVKYNNNKHCKISCLKEKDTIINYLDILQINNLIILHNIDDIKNYIHEKLNKEFKMNLINVNQTMIIECLHPSDVSGNFTSIPSNLCRDYIHRVGHIGWSILCLLSNLHNYTYGNQEDYGFANPSEDYISDVVHKGTSAIKAYLPLLERLKLIKIYPQPPITITNQYGDDEIEYTPNHYVVKWKNPDVDNEYFVETRKKE